MRGRDVYTQVYDKVAMYAHTACERLTGYRPSDRPFSAARTFRTWAIPDLIEQALTPDENVQE